MTHIGMSYEDWRAQYGNPFGLTHDSATRSLMTRHAHSLAADGMVGIGGGVTSYPMLSPHLGNVRPDRLIDRKGRGMQSIASMYQHAIYASFQLEDTDPRMWYDLDVEERRKAAAEGCPARKRRVIPKDRVPQLSYYYRNRAKVRAQQAAYRARTGRKD